MSKLVERMYQEYHIKPRLVPIPCEKCEHNSGCCQGINCKMEQQYPPFTAEKQVKLIDLLTTVTNFVVYMGDNNNLEDIIAEKVTAYKGLLDNKKVQEILKRWIDKTN